MVAEVILDLNFKENARSWASSPQNFACGARNGRNRPLFLFFLLGARGLPGGGWGGTYREIKNAPPRSAAVRIAHCRGTWMGLRNRLRALLIAGHAWRAKK